MTYATVAKDKPGAAPREQERPLRPEAWKARMPLPARPSGERPRALAVSAMPNGDPPDTMLWGESD